MTDETEYWHGGAPGIGVGDYLLTPRQLIGRGHHYAPRPGFMITSPKEADSVYFSSERQFARAYAYRNEILLPNGTRIRRGALYRVRPLGPVEEDPDFAGAGVSWCAPSAIVLAVETTKVSMPAAAAVEAIGRYSTWDDGRPMYLEDGRLQVTWQLEARGVTQQRLDQLIPRRWTPWEDALSHLDRITRLGHI